MGEDIPGHEPIIVRGHGFKLTAWVAIFKDRWDCNTCQCGPSVICPLRTPDAHDRVEPSVNEIVKNSGGRTTPLAFLVDAHGICPKCFLTPFATDALSARAWWDKGQLGITYATAPKWIPDAFSILTHEMDEAMKLKRELMRADRATQQAARQGK